MTARKIPHIVDIPWYRQPIMIPVTAVLLISVMCGFRWGPDNSSAEPLQVAKPVVQVAPTPIVNEIIVPESRQEPNQGLLINGNRNKVCLHFHRHRK